MQSSEEGSRTEWQIHTLESWSMLIRNCLCYEFQVYKCLSLASWTLECIDSSPISAWLLSFLVSLFALSPYSFTQMKWVRQNRTFPFSSLCPEVFIISNLSQHFSLSSFFSNRCSLGQLSSSFLFLCLKSTKCGIMNNGKHKILQSDLELNPCFIRWLVT